MPVQVGILKTPSSLFEPTQQSLLFLCLRLRYESKLSNETRNRSCPHFPRLNAIFTLNVLSPLSPASVSHFLRLPHSVAAAAIRTGQPRNVPIPVAGQHYRTTEASNGSPADSDWLAFRQGGAAAMLYDHMSLCKSSVQMNVMILCFALF